MAIMSRFEREEVGSIPSSPANFYRSVMSKVDGLFWRQEVEIAKFSTPTISILGFSIKVLCLALNERTVEHYHQPQPN